MADARELALYYHPFCPYCVRVLMALRGLDAPLVLHNVIIHPARRQELTAGGGRPTVPCLRIDQPDAPSRWMYESADIIDYLRQRFGG